jgi:hypothetical protein
MRGLFMRGQLLWQRPSLHGERTLLVPGPGCCNRAEPLYVEAELDPSNDEARDTNVVW